MLAACQAGLSVDTGDVELREVVVAAVSWWRGKPVWWGCHTRAALLGEEVQGQDLCFEPFSCHRLRNGGEHRACLALCGLLSSHKVRGWWGSTSSEGCPELNIRYWELLLRYEMSGRVSIERQECRRRPQRAQLDALSLSSLLVTSTHDFVLSEWQFKGIKGRSRCLVLSLGLGPGYSIFYLQVYLFGFLLLQVISFLCCGLLLFPKPPPRAPSFVFAVGNHRTVSCYLFFKSLVSHLESLNKSNVYSLVCSSAGPCELFLNALNGKEVTPV